MKEYDLDLTDESIKQSIIKDSLNRNVKLNKLIEILNSISGNKIISIDGKWGCGKTIFLKQLELINKNNFKEEKPNIDLENLSNFNNNYFVYYYNAWENDFHTSPLLSLIYNLINDFSKIQNQILTGKFEPFNLKEALKTITYNFIDLDKVESFKDIASEIYTLEEKKKALNDIIEYILPEGKRIVFIVDELDRCKPDYAINMLEVIKHFYSNKRLIFLLATNNEQLSYTISNYYGSNFDGYGYLSKFYNLIIELNDISPDKYLNSVIGTRLSDNWASKVLYTICVYFDFQMRDINRILSDFDMLNEYFNTSYYATYGEDSILKHVFLPYCLGLKQKSYDLMSNFLNGEGYLELKNFVIFNHEVYNIVKCCYEDSNSYKVGVEIKEANVLAYLKNKYDLYFSSKTKITEKNKIIQSKSAFIDVFSLLSKYTSIK